MYEVPEVTTRSVSGVNNQNGKQVEKAQCPQCLMQFVETANHNGASLFWTKFCNKSDKK
jgi:hypothetical protein